MISRERFEFKTKIYWALYTIFYYIIFCNYIFKANIICSWHTVSCTIYICMHTNAKEKQFGKITESFTIEAVVNNYNGDKTLTIKTIINNVCVKI